MVLSNKQVVVDAVDLGLCVSFVERWTDRSGTTDWTEMGRLRKGDPRAAEPDLAVSRVAGEAGLAAKALTPDGEAFLALMGAA